MHVHTHAHTVLFNLDYINLLDYSGSLSEVNYKAIPVILRTIIKDGFQVLNILKLLKLWQKNGHKIAVTCP